MRKENQAEWLTSLCFNAGGYWVIYIHRLTKYGPANILIPLPENHKSPQSTGILKYREKILQHIFLVALNLLHQSKLKQLHSLVTASKINGKI